MALYSLLMRTSTHFDYVPYIIHHNTTRDFLGQKIMWTVKSLNGFITKADATHCAFKGWSQVLWNVYKLCIQRLGDYWGVVIRPILCKMAHKPLLYCFVDLCCGLSPIGLLLWLIAGPGDSVEYLNPLPTPTTSPPAHPLLKYATCDLSKIRKIPTNPTGY